MTEQIQAKKPAGIIFTGGPNSVYGDDTPKADAKVFELNVPVLGICYGHQFMAHTLGGKVENAKYSKEMSQGFVSFFSYMLK